MAAGNGAEAPFVLAGLVKPLLGAFDFHGFVPECLSTPPPLTHDALAVHTDVEDVQTHMKGRRRRGVWRRFRLLLACGCGQFQAAFDARAAIGSDIPTGLGAAAFCAARAKWASETRGSVAARPAMRRKERREDSRDGRRGDDDMAVTCRMSFVVRACKHCSAWLQSGCGYCGLPGKF